MTRSRPFALLASTLGLAAFLVCVPAADSAPPPNCVLAGRGLIDNRWVGGDGTWSDASNWSRGVAPGTSASDYACIPDSVTVTVDVSPTPRIDLAAMELGRDATLVLRPGTSLFVWGDQDAMRSVTRMGSLIEVDGATIGGGGRLHVIGTLRIQRSADGAPARLSTHADSDAAYGGRDGILEIGDAGTLDVRGDGDVGLTWGYVVDIRGRARLLDDAALVADHGTTFRLLPHYVGNGAGRLVILNDKGFYEGPARDDTPLATFVNNGRIVKRDSDGKSLVAASYGGAGEVRVRSGYLVLPDEALEPVHVGQGASVGSGTCDDGRACNTDTTPDDPQFASLVVPADDPGGASVVITPLEGVKVKGAVGVPMKVHATGLTATPSDPAIIELRYDASLLDKAGRPSMAADLKVAHANGPGDAYDVVPTCQGTTLPPGAIACVDLTASREDGGDVIMVVRTTDTSRWIVP